MKNPDASTFEQMLKTGTNDLRIIRNGAQLLTSIAAHSMIKSIVLNPDRRNGHKPPERLTVLVSTTRTRNISCKLALGHQWAAVTIEPHIRSARGGSKKHDPALIIKKVITPAAHSNGIAILQMS